MWYKDTQRFWRQKLGYTEGLQQLKGIKTAAVTSNLFTEWYLSSGLSPEPCPETICG